jgi:hypothetical protein
MFFQILDYRGGLRNVAAIVQLQHWYQTGWILGSKTPRSYGSARGHIDLNELEVQAFLGEGRWFTTADSLKPIGIFRTIFI